MNDSQRAAKVAAAVEQLPAALAAARTYPGTVSWERVEKLGATVHRQARLLAGKSKGG